MRIAYLCFEDFSCETGVAKKICLQATHWQRSGHQVALIAPRMKSTPMPAASELEIREFDFPLGSRKYLEPTGMGIREIREFQPEVVYNRYFILPPWHLRLAHEFNLVFEVNSEESEFALYHSRLKRLLHSTWRSRFLRAAAGAVFISKELSLKQEYRLFQKRVVIANGVASPNAGVEHHGRSAGPTRFFFMGNGEFPWHGVDKICELARQLPEARFDIVGDPTVDDCPENVFLHGTKSQNDYVDLLQAADVAIGPLSLHTKSLTEASPLKVREYLAHGIPTIIAYRDTDIPKSTPLTLHIPNRADNIQESIAEIRSFAASARGKRIPWGDVAALDAEKKESERLVFFEDCLRRHSKIAA